MPTIGMASVGSLHESDSTPLKGKEWKMPYCITLRSRTDALITGWYNGSDSRWSTDRYRQKVFDNKRDARPVCDELRSLCPRNAEVINIEAEQDDPSLDAVPAMFSPGIEC
jgi:hypothetical protein